MACPACGEAVDEDAEHAPFCSLRCRAVDLHGWLSGEYQPPGDPDAL